MRDVTETISWREFRAKAAKYPGRIVLADGHDPRVVEAAVRATQEHVASPILIGPQHRVSSLWKQFGGSDEPVTLDPKVMAPKDLDLLSQKLLAIPKFKGSPPAQIHQRLRDPLWLGCLYLKAGLADGFIGGATRTTADTLRAVFSVIGLAPKTSILFGFFFLETASHVLRENRLVLLADCAVVPDPSPKQLAQIGIGGAKAYEFFTGQKARVCFLSFSTHGSAQHALVEKAQQALRLAREKSPDVQMDGEWQADAALDVATASMKGVGDSPMAGRADVLVVPNLDCGNIAYKLAQRLGGCRAVGPVLWGTAQPANDLSRGCLMEDVFDMLALTSLQAQAVKRGPHD